VCFDILHPGHLLILEKAKEEGDFLIVAVNTDASIRRLKGSARPIQPLASRIALLTSLRVVDCVVSFSQDTPLELIEKILPDILVKGGDYTIEQIVGTSTGLVGKLDSGYKDFTKSIYYEMIDRWRSFTEMYAHSKKMGGVAVMSENAGGAQVQYQTDKEQVNKWHNIGPLRSEYACLFPNNTSKDFNMIRFRIKGDATGTPIVLNGIEILSLSDEGYEEN